MAGRISELAALTGATAALTDDIEVRDVSDLSMAATGTNKALTLSELILFLQGHGVTSGLIVDDVAPTDTTVLWADTTEQGSSAATVLSGTVPPTSGDGNDGDFWIDTTTWMIYGPRDSAVWPAGVSLIGEGGGGGLTANEAIDAVGGSSFGGAGVDITHDLGAHTITYYVDKTEIALDQVDNTTDANKPVSTAQAAADALRVLKTGDTMTGPLKLVGNPVERELTFGWNDFDGRYDLTSNDPAGATTPGNIGIVRGTDLIFYVGSNITMLTPVPGSKVQIGSGGAAFLPEVTADPTANLGIATKQYVDAQRDTRVPTTRTLIAASGIWMDGASGGLDLSANRSISIATAGVTNTHLATMPANTIKMNNTGGIASPTDVTIANAQTALAIPALPVTVANGGTGRNTATTAYGLIAAGTTATGVQQTISPGTSGHFLKSGGGSALAAFAQIASTDVSGLGSLATKSTIATADISADAVDNTDLANMPANTIKGNNTGSTADPIDLTIAQVKTMLSINEITVASTAPSSPATNDLWVDTT